MVTVTSGYVRLEQIMQSTHLQHYIVKGISGVLEIYVPWLVSN